MAIKKVDSIWMDGSLIPWDSATDHMLSHTMHYGVGVFEGIRAYQRTDGKVHVFRLREHVERWQREIRRAYLALLAPAPK